MGLPIDIAVQCATRGWPVLPLCWPDQSGKCGCWKSHKKKKEIGKAPLVHPRKDPTTDLEVIRSWWKEWPQANVGVSLEPSGLLAVDADSAEAEAEANQLGLPPTITRVSRCPAWIYSRPDGCPTTDRQGQGQSGKIDLLASPNYLVVFGRHENGCDVFLDHLDLEPAPAPEWAIDWLKEAETAETLEAAELPEDLPPIDLDQLNLLPDTLRRLITEGPQSDDRSRELFRVVTWLAKRFSDETIARIVLDPRFPISDKPLERGRDWTAREIARARSKARIGDPVVAALVEEVLDWMDEQGWSGTAGATDRAVLKAHLDLIVWAGKLTYHAGVRTVADLAQVNPKTSSASHRRLQERGVLLLVQRGRGLRANLWTLRVPDVQGSIDSNWVEISLEPTDDPSPSAGLTPTPDLNQSHSDWYILNTDNTTKIPPCV